ncbi:MAG: tetratricopeptide repeat protein [Mucilaginibacter sp.]
MKKYFFILFILFAFQGYAQQLSDLQKKMLKQMGITTTDPKKALEQLNQMNKKGQHPDFKLQGQKLLAGMATDPKYNDPSTAKYRYFTTNASLVPAKDIKRISSVPKKIFSDVEMQSNTKLLYGKMMVKIPVAEKSIITSIVSQHASPDDLNRASVTAMLQGHRLAALGIAMQAVIAKPGNLNFQNNMAALLTDNGYPENAIPYLNKIRKALPNNSTVLNNLGYAWLNLGATDSARRYFSAGAILNPNNGETTCGNGIIDELQGDPIKAADEYGQSFEQSPSSMIEIILGHEGKGNPLENMTFDQIKDKLTIYEYFKKDWVILPDLSNTVSGYQSDIALQNGYKAMFEDLLIRVARIEDSLIKAKEADLPTVSNNSAKYFLTAIGSYIGPFLKSYQDDELLLDVFVQAQRKKAEDAESKIDKCEARNPIWDQYLQTVNPVIKKFYEKKQEKFRVWINAYITYMLLNDHRDKGSLLPVIEYVKLFIGKSALIGALHREPDRCYPHYNDDALTAVDEPELPKLLCPVNFDPISNFNNSNSNISKSATGTVPNVTVAMGSRDGGIAEPGKGATPFIKTSQGDVSTSGVNDQDNYGQFKNGIDPANANDDIEVTMDDQITITPGPNTRPVEDNFSPLANEIKADEVEVTMDPVIKITPGPSKRLQNSEDDLAPLVNIIIAHNLKEWLQHQLGTDCDDLKKMEQNPPAPPHRDIKKDLDDDMRLLQDVLNQVTQKNNAANAQQIESGNKIMDEIAKAQQSVEQKNQTDPGWQDKIGLTGVSPTIVNSLQTPGTNTSYFKGLFQ